MKIKFSVILGMALTAGFGCSSVEKSRQASGSFDYIEAEAVEPIKVPEDLDNPNFTGEFELPKLGPNAPKNHVGKKLVVASPSLVVPIVSGSYIEEGSKSAKVKFDQVNDSEALNQSIWNTLLNYLDENDVGVASFDEDNGVLVTDWMLATETIPGKWYTVIDKKSEVGRVFEFDLAMEPHGRTAELSVKLKDYAKSINDDIVETREDVIARTEEVDVLNKVIAHYEYQQGVKVTKVRRKIKQGLDTELGFDADGEPAFVIDGIYDITWPRLQLVMRNLGFDVKDLDKSNGLVFVSYTGPGAGWWSNLLSTKKKLLEVGDYRLKVVSQNEKTIVTFMTEDSEPFEVNQVTELFEPFADTMSKNNLDI